MRCPIPPPPSRRKFMQSHRKFGELTWMGLYTRVCSASEPFVPFARFGDEAGGYGSCMLMRFAALFPGRVGSKLPCSRERSSAMSVSCKGGSVYEGPRIQIDVASFENLGSLCFFFLLPSEPFVYD